MVLKVAKYMILGKGSCILSHFPYWNQSDLLQVSYVTAISGSIWWSPGLGDHVCWRGYAKLGTAQSPILWHFKAPSVSLLFKPLGMTHLWQCYITHNALKAPAALPWKTVHSWLILPSLGQRKHTAQQDVSMVHGLLQHSWCSPCSAEVHLKSKAQKRCLHMLKHYKHQPIKCVAMDLLGCCIIQHKPNTERRKDWLWLCLMTVMQQLCMIFLRINWSLSHKRTWYLWSAGNLGSLWCWRNQPGTHRHGETSALYNTQYSHWVSIFTFVTFDIFVTRKVRSVKQH